MTLLTAPGCTAPKEPAAVGHPDPSVKIRGMKKAARERDLATARQLVRDLDSDDPAVRFYAINALRDMTGETFEYRYYFDERQRKPSLKTWQQWLDQQVARTQ